MEEKPSDIKNVDFFTRQVLEPSGFAFMWVFKPMCPECGNDRMRKLKKKDKVYTCESCKHTMEILEYNALLKYNVEYTCPDCGHKGEAHDKWEKPKSKTAPTVLKFKCSGCGTILRVSRMKKKKKK